MFYDPVTQPLAHGLVMQGLGDWKSEHTTKTQLTTIIPIKFNTTERHNNYFPLY